MVRAHPVSASTAVTTIQRQAAARGDAVPLAQQSARDDITLPIVSGAGQTAKDVTSRATVRLDGTALTHQTTMMLARIATQGTNKPVQPGSMVLVRPTHPQASRAAERSRQEITVTSVPASTRPANLSRGDTPLVLSRAPASAASLIARQEMASMPGVTAPAASEQPATSPAPLPNTTTRPGAGRVADVDELVERTLHRLMRQLAVETERRGWVRWS